MGVSSIVASSIRVSSIGVIGVSDSREISDEEDEEAMTLKKGYYL